MRRSCLSHFLFKKMKHLHNFILRVPWTKCLVPTFSLLNLTNFQLHTPFIYLASTILSVKIRRSHLGDNLYLNLVRPHKLSLPTDSKMDSSTPSKLRNMRWFEMHFWPIMEERKLWKNICFWSFSFLQYFLSSLYNPHFLGIAISQKKILTDWLRYGLLNSHTEISFFEDFHISRRNIRLLFGCAKVNNPEQVFLRCEKEQKFRTACYSLPPSHL